MGLSKTGSQCINNPTSRFPPSLWLTFGRWFLGCCPQASAHSLIGGAQPCGRVPLWLGRRLFPWWWEATAVIQAEHRMQRRRPGGGASQGLHQAVRSHGDWDGAAMEMPGSTPVFSSWGEQNTNSTQRGPDALCSEVSHEPAQPDIIKAFWWIAFPAEAEGCLCSTLVTHLSRESCLILPAPAFW